MNFFEYWFNADETMLFPNECEIAAKAAWEQALEEAVKVCNPDKYGAGALACQTEIRNLKTNDNPK